MRCIVAGHRDGLDQLGDLVQEIQSTVSSCPVELKARSAHPIRSFIKKELIELGWSDEFSVDPAVSGISITSVKDEVGLCVQTGNMGRMYADLVKLQTLYTAEKIRAGAVVLPTSSAARKMGDNIANANRFEIELNVFSRVIHMPLVIFSFEEDLQ